jgi:hypothetical protein
MADILLNSENQRDRTWRRLQPFSYLATALAAESERRVLWLPVWFGSGIALYFGIMYQPPPNR